MGKIKKRGLRKFYIEKFKEKCRGRIGKNMLLK